MIALLRQLSWVRSVSEVLLQFLGGLLIVIQITDYFSPNPEWTAFVKSCWWLVCSAALLLAAHRIYSKRSVEARIGGTDIEVEIRIGNVLNQKGAIVVGSNTTFDTSLEDQTISRTSVQGQFTERYCPNVAELDHKLAQALQAIPSTNRDRTDKPYGKVKEYEFGTVAPVEISGHKAYFVVIARLNSDRVASSTADEFLDALPNIWNGIRERGGMESLVCPILGSGYSRLNFTRSQLVKMIIRSFVVASSEGKLTEKLSLVIHPKDFTQNAKDPGQNDLNLEALHRFLEYECWHARFLRTSGSPPSTGTPLQ